MKYRTFLIVTVLLFVIDCDGAASGVFPSDEDDSLPVVHTPVGSIRGLRAEDGNYSMYMGIPYAHVDPDNMFGNAIPHTHFDGIFDAFDDTAICPQIEEFNFTIVGSLDCLHVNVYVPNSASNDIRFPVFVWIFGGGFNFGFAGRYVYGPSFLVRHDIILVTFNYRLGPYGFMCLDTPEIPGNQGLKDQELALKWVRDNIEGFGGDNTRITLGGNSVGGVSVDYHLYYGEETNLYQKIIPQSGVALFPSLIIQSNPNAPFDLANVFNHTANDLQDALSFLATVDPHELIAATREASHLRFLPCIEQEFENVRRFIPELPINMRIQKVKDVEVLIGLTNDERNIGVIDLNTDYGSYWLNVHFDFNELALFAEMRDIVNQFYVGDQDITEDLKQVLTDMSSDFLFNHPIFRTVNKYFDYGVQVMYLYQFSYSGGRNFAKHRLNITGGGAAHADELGYLFDISYMEKPIDPEDQLIVDRITELWTNFIKYGNPTPEPTELIPVIWQPMTKDKWHYLNLNTEVTVSMRPFHARTAFLDLLFKANEVYERGYKREEGEEGNEEIDDPESSSARKLVLHLSVPVMLLLKYLL